jgi:hypothetical protein
LPLPLVQAELDIVTQVAELFDVFCFNLCWQALRGNFLTAKQGEAAEDDENCERADEPAVFSWVSMNEFLTAAHAVCNGNLLEGRTEIIETAFEQCSAVMRMSLAHKEGKTPRAKGVLTIWCCQMLLSSVASFTLTNMVP